jgi:hypothetical protein
MEDISAGFLARLTVIVVLGRDGLYMYHRNYVELDVRSIIGHVIHPNDWTVRDGSQI